MKPSRTAYNIIISTVNQNPMRTYSEPSTRGCVLDVHLYSFVLHIIWALYRVYNMVGLCVREGTRWHWFINFGCWPVPRAGKGRKDLPPRDFIVRNEMFSAEHFSRISGCGAAVKEAKTVGGGGDTQAVLILGTHKLRWHEHRRHDGWSLGSGCGERG